ncbi:hypothetical protein ND861_01315 [Leptospira sp. 2 VSF19]|uniref:DUF1176 domain-containing protein n=1 Tax=Leptospira soteropolitanensis TaxID=2950025 RepID=A0AAW5VF75_9LEPT|nr:hypothetical protein [Leptospira soteropolitanensis]MCW7491284.1 hypothetical protein [Leptospira soteropolitanensis]MCW7498869.1 hypothetical protein [Leptospira soteropolitanensis]MCW7521539.1 hypothetical protein [Leptospira soteropolitanensis]MCW7524972.1 hypothetical protein [Leptospira soteropolitanensis]MCW7528840.1 hypothetical protein [Leptospira soteropolitanensis]
MIKQLYIYFGLILLFFVSEVSFADRTKTNLTLQSLAEEVSAWKKRKPSQEIRKQIQMKQSFFMDDGDCRLEPASRISSVTYFRFSCQKVEDPMLIQFQSNQKKKLDPGTFRLRAVHRIGNKQYLEIETGLIPGQTKFQARLNTDDTDLDYPSKKQIPAVIEGKQSIPSYKPIQNPNLFYFKSISQNPKRRKEVPSNIEVFFDSSCPLEYIEKDESFYWDQTVSFVFRITCIRDSAYSLIRVPSSASGDLITSNTIWKDPKPGDRVLGSAVLKKITETQTFWEKIVLYYE